MIIELQLIDIFAELGAYLFIREFVRDRGYLVCIDGLHHLHLPLIDRKRLGADMVKVIWSPDLLDGLSEERAEELRLAIKRAGVDRVILCRCDTTEAIRWGQSFGIRLFQGHYIDSRLRAARPPAIAAARQAHARPQVAAPAAAREARPASNPDRVARQRLTRLQDERRRFRPPRSSRPSDGGCRSASVRTARDPSSIPVPRHPDGGRVRPHPYNPPHRGGGGSPFQRRRRLVLPRARRSDRPSDPISPASTRLIAGTEAVRLRVLSPCSSPWRRGEAQSARPRPLRAGGRRGTVGRG